MSMGSPKVIDGKAYAKLLLSRIAPIVDTIEKQHEKKPSLAILRIGESPASALYVKNKIKTFADNGLSTTEFWHPHTTKKEDLLKKIQILNEDPSYHGIILQLPLPPSLEESRDLLISAISPEKDVDGLTPLNQGLLSTYRLTGLFPCTPVGCLFLLKALLPSFSGLHAVVVGRSNLVGQPMGILLLKNNATVTFAHSHTQDLPSLLQTADIVVSAVGKPSFIQGSWFKKDAIVLDVGINTFSSSFVGDVDTTQALARVKYITPVPGGIGPLTVATLAYNTVKAAQNLLYQKPIIYDFDILKNV